MMFLENFTHYLAYANQENNSMNLDSLFILKLALSFLIDETNGYEEGARLDLGSVLGDMDTKIWVDLKPADPAVWYDWKSCLEELLKSDIKVNADTESLNIALTKEQAFMAAFNFLDSLWESNHDVTLGDVIQVVERCIQDVESGIQNPVWNQWIQYVESEVGREYSFD